MFGNILHYCIEKLRGERTLSGIYHLLTGKRSAQTMQDAKIYGLDNLFGIYKTLNRQTFDEQCKRYVDHDLIQLMEDKYPVLTAKERWEWDLCEVNWYFDGMRAHEQLAVFELRLFLMIQTLSHLIAGNHSFVPIIDEPKAQHWMRSIYQKEKHHLEAFTTELYKELYELLARVPEREAQMFTSRLTGHRYIGQSYQQIAKDWSISEVDVHLYLQNMMYYIYQSVNKDRNRFRVLALLLEDQTPSLLVTQSAKKTYHYLQMGWSLSEISKKRRLKESTIQDHIVEIALVSPEFDFHPFMTEADHEVINRTAKELSTQKLKRIHQELAGRYTYFQLRLALSQPFMKKGHQHV